jgi:hypothetical protein
MVKRAPVNVRYLWLFGEHILTRSFTARDPKLTLMVGGESLGYSQPEGMETDKLSSSR